MTNYESEGSCLSSPEKKKRITAIVLAAGQGKRMKSRVQKQFLELEGYPVLYYSLRCLESWDKLDEIILVTGEKEIAYCRQEIVDRYSFSKVGKIIAGGKERYDSVYEGLKVCGEADYVLIHDGARPFLTHRILERVWEALQTCDACTVGMPSKDTIKIADEDGCIAVTPPRNLVWNIQTPQAFVYPMIREAHERARAHSMEGVTDDAMLVEREMGCRVRLVEGSYKNIKITTPEDLEMAGVLTRTYLNE